MGRLKKFPMELVPNKRTYIVRLAALAVSADHPLANGQKMQVLKKKTLLKIPSIRLVNFELLAFNSSIFSAPETISTMRTAL